MYSTTGWHPWVEMVVAHRVCGCGGCTRSSKMNGTSSRGPRWADTAPEDQAYRGMSNCSQFLFFDLSVQVEVCTNGRLTCNNVLSRQNSDSLARQKEMATGNFDSASMQRSQQICAGTLYSRLIKYIGRHREDSMDATHLPSNLHVPRADFYECQPVHAGEYEYLDGVAEESGSASGDGSGRTSDYV